MHTDSLPAERRRTGAAGLTKVPIGIDGWPIAELSYVTTDNRFAWITGQTGKLFHYSGPEVGFEEITIDLSKPVSGQLPCSRK